MLAVCKTIGSRDFCPSLVKLHIAQLTSSNRNTNPSLADQVYNANEWRLHIFNQAYREHYACKGQYSLREIDAFQNRRRRGSSVLQLTIVECMPNVPPVYLSPPGRRKIDLFLQYGLKKKLKKPQISEVKRVQCGQGLTIARNFEQLTSRRKNQGSFKLIRLALTGKCHILN